MPLYAVFTVDVVKAAKRQIEGATDVGRYYAKFAGYLEYAIKLRQHDVDWPKALLPPDIRSSLKAIQDTNNVFFGALSWILLHEIAHIHMSHEPLLPPDMSIRQEEDADRFATQWIFNEVQDEMQREFRVLSVGVALAWLLLFEPIGGDAKHPPAHARIAHASSFFQANEMSVALEVVAHLFKILFFPRETPPTFQTSQALFDWTIAQLRGLAA